MGSSEYARSNGRRVGTHRRIRALDLLKYQQHEEAERQTALDALTEKPRSSNSATERSISPEVSCAVVLSEQAAALKHPLRSLEDVHELLRDNGLVQSVAQLRTLLRARP